MDELLQKAAEAIGMPPTLAERSAQARAEKEGTTVEAVLREWAGEDADEANAPAAEAAGDVEDAPTDGAVEEADDAPGAVDTDQLLKLASEAKRMPEKLVLSSAEARARNSNQSVDEVLATWAGIDLDEVEVAAPADEPVEAPADESADETPAEDATEESVSAAPVAAAAAVSAALSMDELLERVAEAKGMPAALAKRSAEARAKKTGEPLEAVLAEWAGIDPSEVAGATDTSEPSEEPAVEEPAPDAEPADDAEEASADQAEDTSSDGVEIIEAVGVDDDDDAPQDEDDNAPTPRTGYPTWLAAAFILIPLFAVTYILVAPNGPDCGTAGQLKVDEASGLAVNCDGSDYGSSSVDFFAEGGAIYGQCAACHGAGGEGGAGPAFSGGAVLATFPADSCDDHVKWVTLGTANWPESTYGATAKPVGGVGVMPGYEATLTPEQIASVALYERVQFGGQDLEEAERDCGLVVDEESAEAAAP